METSILLWGLLFSCIGLGYFTYGRKQKRAVPWICGLALMLYPYFVPNAAALIGIGSVLCAVPYFIRY